MGSWLTRDLWYGDDPADVDQETTAVSIQRIPDASPQMKHNGDTKGSWSDVASSAATFIWSKATKENLAIVATAAVDTGFAKYVFMRTAQRTVKLDVEQVARLGALYDQVHESFRRRSGHQSSDVGRALSPLWALLCPQSLEITKRAVPLNVQATSTGRVDAKSTTRLFGQTEANSKLLVDGQTDAKSLHVLQKSFQPSAPSFDAVQPRQFPVSSTLESATAAATAATATAAPSPAIGADVKTAFTSEAFTKLATLGCDMSIFARIKDPAVLRLVTDALQMTLVYDATCSITLDDLVVNGRLVKGVAAIIQFDGHRWHVYLYKRSAIQSWLEKQNVNPLTQSIVDTRTDLYILS